MTYLEKLDAVLLSLQKHHSEGYHNLERIDVCLGTDAPEIEFGEMKAILEKLYRDGFIDMEKKEVYKKNGIDTYYRIRIEGRIFNEQGGFTQQQQNVLAQNRKVEALEKHQIVYANRITWLTIVIAVGTTVAAWYYGIEIWKFYCHYRR